MFVVTGKTTYFYKIYQFLLDIVTNCDELQLFAVNSLNERVIVWELRASSYQLYNITSALVVSTKHLPDLILHVYIKGIDVSIDLQCESVSSASRIDVFSFLQMIILRERK